MRLIDYIRTKEVHVFKVHCSAHKSINCMYLTIVLFSHKRLRKSESLDN